MVSQSVIWYTPWFHWVIWYILWSFLQSSHKHHGLSLSIICETRCSLLSDTQTFGITDSYLIHSLVSLSLITYKLCSHCQSPDTHYDLTVSHLINNMVSLSVMIHIMVSVSLFWYILWFHCCHLIHILVSLTVIWYTLWCHCHSPHKHYGLTDNNLI